MSREVARAVARAGWEVIPIRVDTDDKAPCVAWKRKPEDVCRSESDVVDKWPSRWPRWAAICGVPRAQDGRSLACLDADSAEAADGARRLLPGATRVRTGRQGGEHTWVSVSAAHLRWRGYLRTDLDWRGGDCIALLPGSLWAPVTSPGVVYQHIGGPALPEVLDLPLHLVKAFAKRAPDTRAPRGRRAQGGQTDLSPSGAFEKFLSAAAAHGALVKRTGRPGEAFVQCPGAGHPDRNRNRPCLHVDARDGGIWLRCFGSRGCTTEEIVRAFGLSKADLFDDSGREGVEFEIIE